MVAGGSDNPPTGDGDTGGDTGDNDGDSGDTSTPEPASGEPIKLGALPPCWPQSNGSVAQNAGKTQIDQLMKRRLHT